MTKAKVKENSDEARADDDNPHPRKRQRVSQACDQCRSRRNKCDGKQPSCSVCLPLGRTCTYGSNPKKRGLPTGYVRGLEIIWGLVFRKVDGSQDVVQSLLKGADGGSLRSAIVGKDSTTAESLLDTWRKSPIAKEIERLLSGAEGAEEDQSIDVKEDIQPDPNRTLGRSPHSDSVPALEWRLPPDAIADIPAATELSRAPALAWQGSDPRNGLMPQPLGSALELPSNTFGLLETYFAHTHSWFPIIEKTDVLRLSYSYATEHLQTGGSQLSGNYAALWAILAYTSAQSTASPTEGSTSKNGGADLTAADIYSRARQFIPSETGSFELGHVQALLLLSLLQVSRRAWSAAWMLVGQAVRIAISLGITSQSSQDFVSRDASLGKRCQHVGLGCFVLDTLISSQMRRKPYLNRIDAAHFGLLEVDGLEEWAPWIPSSGVISEAKDSQMGRQGPVHTLSSFNQLVELLGIASEIHESIPRGYDPQPLAEELRAWHQKLPPHCRLPQGVSCPAPPVLILHLSYLATHSALQAHVYRSRNPHVASEGTNPDANKDIEMQISHIISSVKEPWPGLDILRALFLSENSRSMQSPPSTSATTNMSHSTQLRPTLNTNSNWYIPQQQQQQPPPQPGFRQGTAVSIDSIAERRSMPWPPTPNSHEPFAPSPNSSLGLPVDNRMLPLLDNPQTSPGTQSQAGLPLTSTFPQRTNGHDVSGMSAQGRSAFHVESTSIGPSTTAPKDVELSSALPFTMDPYRTSPDDMATSSRDMRAAADEMEAFFDEMAMLDGQELSNGQPQFMHNLGFAADTLPADFLPFGP